MPSTFTGLNIAYTGLVAANTALNTTANNIANIETEGYSRQVVNQTAATAMRAFQSYGCVGAGVDTLGAERVRDIYYDEKYWTNNSKLGDADKKQYYCSLIETYLVSTSQQWNHFPRIQASQTMHLILWDRQENLQSILILYITISKKCSQMLMMRLKLK
jgi:flagellar hook-associated protein FlgK